MAPTGPFLLPDGRHLAQVLKSSDQDSVAGGEPRRSRGQSTKRGKDLQFAQVAFQHARVAAAAATGTHSAQELAELRALEAVGARRRRRWLNDRVLRELAGPMSAADIERQFKPVPFGWRSVSALEVVSRPQHAVLWEGFRSIDADKEARVLQRWEQHNREQVEAQRGVVVPSAAAQALQRWGRVSKKGRAALRKANVHTLLALEAQVLDFLEAGECAALRISGLDGWGRLLVHAIADFWGLSSSTTTTSDSSLGSSGGLATCPEGLEGEEEEEDGGGRLGEVAGPGGTTGSGHSARPQQQQQQLQQQKEQQALEASSPVITVWHRTQAFQPLPPPDITVTDVVEALGAAGGSLSAGQLAAYMRTHVHGSETGRTEEWVVV